MRATITYDRYGNHERWSGQTYTASYHAGQWAIYHSDEQRIITLRETATDAIRTIIEWETADREAHDRDRFPELRHAACGVHNADDGVPTRFP